MFKTQPPQQKAFRKTSWMTWLFDTVCVFSCLEHSSNLSWIFTTWLGCSTPNLELLVRSDHFVGNFSSSKQRKWMLITKQIPSSIFWRLDLLNPGNDPISSRTWVNLIIFQSHTKSDVIRQILSFPHLPLPYIVGTFGSQACQYIR